MKISLRSLLAVVLLAPALAPAQTTTTTVIGVPPSLQVSRLAPQLISFAGSQANFDSLVSGLALGTAVSLSSALPNGQVQLVSFTPQGTMTVTQIAQALETARQDLISRGVAAPTAQQVATTLTGGTSAVTTTTNPPNGNPSPAALIQGQSGAGGTTPPSPAQIIQNQRGSNISDTPTVGNISNTPSSSATTTAPATTPSAPLAPTPAAPGTSRFATPTR